FRRLPPKSCNWTVYPDSRIFPARYSAAAFAPFEPAWRPSRAGSESHVTVALRRSTETAETESPAMTRSAKRRQTFLTLTRCIEQHAKADPAQPNPDHKCCGNTKKNCHKTRQNR